MDNDLKIDQERLLTLLDHLSQIGALEGGGVSRLALSAANVEARDLMVGWMKELGMTVEIDQVGNILALRPGVEDLPPVMLGSHLDTVTTAGRYDGSYGVLAGLEVVQTLNEKHIETRRPLAVAAFTNEEGVRFAPGMMGSTVYAGKITAQQALEIVGFDGSTFGEQLARSGYAGKMKPGAVRPYAFLELHIEQGPVLEESGIPIGVVEAVTGITWLGVTVTGRANHAGTTPLSYRRDAGLVAAKMICNLREIAETIGEPQRATCGMMAFKPDAINVIPGQAVFTVDLRNSNGEALLQAEEMFNSFTRELDEQEGVHVEIRDIDHVLPVEFDPQIVKLIESTSRDLSLPCRRMVSGAGHDAQLLAQFCPTAMIFVPSQGGISHNPKEYTSPEELESGANVLLHAALRLANSEELH